MLFTVVLPLLIALTVAFISIPAIIKVADLKHLMDEPDEDRKTHKKRTPTLGGIAIFAGTVFSFSFFNDYLSGPNEIKYMTSAMVLLFFAGIKDDILLLTPLKKLAVQMICALLITLMGQLYLTNMWGMFGVTDIPPVVGIFITFFIIVALINAFNLIDGVNGLAGGLGLIASIFFGCWFYLADFASLSILSFALAGSLLGFLVYNFHRGKIFMGDTGSMMIGFIISILAIKFIECNRIEGIENSAYYIKAAPGVAVATVMIPLFDMTRVFCQRILKGKHPFSADRRHIHHMLMDIGLNHTAISLILYFTSLILIALSLQLKELRSMTQALILLGLCTMMTFVVFFIKRMTLKNRNQSTGK
jgi:UDP-GlcNAc:undecaprenyl-phosphate GlcNAc-1-phosphate transferase